MGLLVYPVYLGSVPPTQTRTTGEFLAAEFPSLDVIAAEHGLTPITAFADPREVPDDFEGTPDELDDLLGPCEDWFSPQEGSRALLDLAKLIRQRGEVAARLESPDEIIEELEDLARQLMVAVKVGAQFRLELS
jgi:hypothetical protein